MGIWVNWCLMLIVAKLTRKNQNLISEDSDIGIYPTIQCLVRVSAYHDAQNVTLLYEGFLLLLGKLSCFGEFLRATV